MEKMRVRDVIGEPKSWSNVMTDEDIALPDMRADYRGRLFIGPPARHLYQKCGRQRDSCAF